MSTQVGHEAGQLGLLGLPVFVFQEGNDRTASRLFPQIAKLTRGAYCKFDRSSPDQLKRCWARSRPMPPAAARRC